MSEKTPAETTTANPDECILKVWVIYDHPRDVPDFVVVRKHDVMRSGVLVFSPRAFLFRDLEHARAWCGRRGLTPIPRQPDDDPVIVESWI